MNGSITANTDTLNYIRNYPKISLEADINFTSIIILTYNQLDYTKLCIESIRAFTPKDCYEIIIVDNNSTDGTVDWLKEQPDLNVIFNKFNLGFPVGCNMGIDIAKGENILLLNNDTIVNPDWLSKLNKALYSNDNIGAVGAITNNCSNGQQIGVMYVNVEQMINLSREIYMLNKEHWEYRIKLVGFCYMIKKSVLDEVGLLDSIFTPGNYEDDDISLRILGAGYNLLLCKDTFIHHFGSMSFNEDRIIYSNYLEVNRIKLNNKWGFDFNANNYVKEELVIMLNSKLKKNIKVLEINCGIGSTLMSLKNIFKNVELYGMEKNKNMAKVSKGICNLVVGGVDEMEESYDENFFDYIILGDVLEHCITPWLVLRRISKYLKPNGRVITAIPNINYIEVINELAKGRFSYLNTGILDINHLRFFTLSEINKLFNVGGYEIKTLIKDVALINEDNKKLINGLCNLYGDKFKDEYTYFQYRIAAKKVIDTSSYNRESLIKLKHMIMRIDAGFDNNEVYDEIFKLCEEDYFANDISYLINNNIINKEIVLEKISNEIMNRGLNHLLDDFEDSIL